MNTDPTTAVEPRAPPDATQAPPAGRALPPPRARSKPFSAGGFAAALAGVLLTPAVWAVWQAVAGETFGARPWVVSGGALLAASAWAFGWGAIAARAGRRLAFYEVFAASLLFNVVVMVLAPMFRPLSGLAGELHSSILGGAGRALGEVVSAWESQGKLIEVLGLQAWCGFASLSAFFGSTLAFLFATGGRYDASLSYEVFVAKSHLRLEPRTLLALFGVVVTGLVPGLLVAVGYVFSRQIAERRAAAQGIPLRRDQLPATVLMTLISIGAVAIGVWTLTVVLSVMSGFEADLKHKILGSNAHGVVLKYGDNDFTEWRGVRHTVLGVPGVTGATPFLYGEVMLSADKQMTGSIVRGIDASTAGTVTDLPRIVDEGKLEDLEHPDKIPPPRFGEAGQHSLRGLFEDKKPGGAPPPERKGPVLPGVVIGRELARTLRVSVGDVVNMISPFGDLGPAGPQPKSRPFRVAAVVYSGMYEYDVKFAYVSLPEAQRFFGTGDVVTGLELKVNDVDAAPAIMRRVLTAVGGYPFKAKDWGELNRNLFSALMMEKVVMAIILGFIVLVASCTIVATLIMLVLEKTREIAVLKSMGAGRPSIMKIFVAEGLVIGAVGTLFGLFLGYGTCLLIDKVGIPLNPEVYYISNLPVLVDPAQFGFVALAAMVLSYFATIFPASKASRLHPVDGLRSE